MTRHSDDTRVPAKEHINSILGRRRGSLTIQPLGRNSLIRRTRSRNDLKRGTSKRLRLYPCTTNVVYPFKIPYACNSNAARRFNVQQMRARRTTNTPPIALRGISLSSYLFRTDRLSPRTNKRRAPYIPTGTRWLSVRRGKSRTHTNPGASKIARTKAGVRIHRLLVDSAPEDADDDNCRNSNIDIIAEDITTENSNIVLGEDSFIATENSLSRSHLRTSRHPSSMPSRHAVMLLFAVISASHWLVTPGEAVVKAVKLSGDVILGGLFPMHEKVGVGDDSE